MLCLVINKHILQKKVMIVDHLFYNWQLIDIRQPYKPYVLATIRITNPWMVLQTINNLPIE